MDDSSSHSLQVKVTAVAAKSLQSCPTLCDPIDGSPPGSHSWDSPGKSTGVGCHFLLQCMKVKSESEVTQSWPTLHNTMDCSLPGSSIHGISRQEFWSGLPLPSPKVVGRPIIVKQESFSLYWAEFLFFFFPLCQSRTKKHQDSTTVCLSSILYSQILLSLRVEIILGFIYWSERAGAFCSLTKLIWTVFLLTYSY